MFSVVVVTRDRQSLLRDCLNSLVKQSIQPDEIIVVDNASKDNTRKVVKKFVQKYPYISYHLCKKIGIPYTRNMGVEKAKYSAIAFLDDDCVPTKTWYESVKKMSALSHNYIIQGDATNSSPNNIWSTLLFYKNQVNLQIVNFASTEKVNNFPIVDFLDTKNFIISKNIINKLGGFFDPKHILAGDLYFQEKLKKNNVKILLNTQMTVSHYYQTSFAGYCNKLYWARKCKNIFGREKIEESEHLQKTKNMFPQLSTTKLRKNYLSQIKSLKAMFFDKATQQFSTPKKILARIILIFSNLYLK